MGCHGTWKQHASATCPTACTARCAYLAMMNIKSWQFGRTPWCLGQTDHIKCWIWCVARSQDDVALRALLRRWMGSLCGSMLPQWLDPWHPMTHDLSCGCVYIYILYVWCIYIYIHIHIYRYIWYVYIYRFRRHLQPHTGVHEHIYFAVCIVIFLSFDSVFFLVLSFVHVIFCHLCAMCLAFFLQFFIVFLHVLMILLCFCDFSMVFFDFLQFLVGFLHCFIGFLWFLHFFNCFLWFSLCFQLFSLLFHWVSSLFNGFVDFMLENERKFWKSRKMINT